MARAAPRTRPASPAEPLLRSRCTSTSRSASRSARTATSSSTRGRPRAGRGRASTRSWRRCGPSSSCARTPWTTRSGAGRPALETVYLGGGTPSLLPRRGRGRAAGPRPGAISASPTTPRSRSRPTPGRTSAATLGRSGPPASTRISIGAQAMSAAGLRRLGRRHRAADVVRGRRRGAGGRHRLGQPRPPLRRPGRVAGRLDRDARRGARARTRPPLPLRPHPRRPRRRGTDRSRRRPPADDRRRASLADGRASPPGRGPGGRRVPPRRPPAGRGRLARLRDQQLGAPRP